MLSGRGLVTPKSLFLVLLCLAYALGVKADDSKTTTPTFNEIFSARQNQNWLNCSELCERYLRGNPNNCDVLIIKCECELSLGKFKHARQTLDRLERLSPRERRTDYLEAHLAWYSGNLRTAKFFIDRLSKRGVVLLPGEAWVKAKIYDGLFDYKTAIETLSQQPELTGLKYFSSGGGESDAKAAISALNLLNKVGLQNEIVWLLKDFPKGNLPYPALKVYATAASDLCRRNLAVELWRELLRRNKLSAQDPDIEIVNRLVLLGDLDFAVKELNRLQPSLNQSTRYWCLRTDALSGAGRLAEAEVSIDQALKLQPDAGELYFRKSQILDRLNRKAESMAYLNKAIDYDPKNLVFRQRRIFSEIGLPEDTHVVADFDELIGAASSQEKATYQIKKARYLARRGDLKSAVSALQLARQFRQNHSEILELLKVYCGELSACGIDCPECSNNKQLQQRNRP